MGFAIQVIAKTVGLYLTSQCTVLVGRLSKTLQSCVALLNLPATVSVLRLLPVVTSAH
jgi:hypothetical protein